MSTAMALRQQTQVSDLKQQLARARAMGAERAEEMAEKGKAALQRLSAKYEQEAWVQKIARFAGAALCGLTVSAAERIRSMLPDWLSERIPDSLLPAVVGVAAIIAGMYTENAILASVGEGAVLGAIALFTSNLTDED